jgi:hypothetical protein
VLMSAHGTSPTSGDVRSNEQLEEKPTSERELLNAIYEYRA